MAWFSRAAFGVFDHDNSNSRTPSGWRLDFFSDVRGTKQRTSVGLLGHNQKTCRLCYNPIKRVVKLNFVHLFLFLLKIFPCTNPLNNWLHPLQRLLVKSIRCPCYIGGDVSYVCCRSLQPRNIIVKKERRVLDFEEKSRPKRKDNSDSFQVRVSLNPSPETSFLPF